MIKLRPTTAWPACFVLLTVATCNARAAPSSVAVLHLSDGDFLAGYLADCDETGVLRWHMRGATAPFDFPSAVVRAAHFPSPDTVPSPKGDFLFELANGDMLYGSLASVTPERFELESARFGRLHVERAEIRRIVRLVDASPSEYRGPNGLAEWTQSEANQWREEAGRLITSTARARVQKKLAIPEKARIEFELAGGRDLEFAFVLSAGTSDAQLQQGYRFEVWQKSLVALRELEDRADMTVVCELNASENRVQIEVLLDQKAGTMWIHAPNGKQLATIKVPPQTDGKLLPLQWISVVNGKGELRFERLAIGRWSGQLPPQIEADKAGISRTDGSVLYGDVVAYDPDNGQLSLRTDETNVQSIDAATVASIFLAPAVQTADSAFRVGLHDGTRFSGTLTKVAGDKVYVSRHGIDEALACLVDHVRSIVSLTQDINLRAPRGSSGWLELDGVHSHGSLVAATATGANTCLVWRPRQSTTGSPLDRDVSGRIVYRDSSGTQLGHDRSALAQQQRELQVQQRRLQIVQQQQRDGVIRRTTRIVAGGQPARMTPNPNGAGVLYLLAGDRIPCDATEIDDAGVHFKSSVVDATFAPHTAVKALELVSNWKAFLDQQKQARLLTLPRMQKDNPPTHLVASTGGDILRTNVITLGAENLVIESRLETKKIPRDRVACLIWLHNESDQPEADLPQPAPETGSDDDALRVLAVRADGVRLTFVPKECTGSELIGASKLLGNCQLALGKVDYLVLGALIDSLTDEQVFHEWKLSDAIEPRYVNEPGEGAAGDPSAVAGSGLIGKPAPNFSLELLEGGEFQLSEQKGHVVVLDFWASWCGPCMQALPQVDAVVAEFADRGVKLVAVNMQEDRDAITSALERLKIKPSVALDIDGAAAEHYQVTAIPHTVVIDAEGNIARLFIGSSPESAALLRTTIEELLSQLTTE